MTDHDPILAKVRKLLALAEDPAATEHESEIYTAKAAQLIADYGIDQAPARPGRPGSDPVGDRVLTLDAPYATDKADLLATVAIRCVAGRCTAPAGSQVVKELSLHLFGHRPDLERTGCSSPACCSRPPPACPHPVPPGEHKAAFRRSWLAGFRMAVTAGSSRPSSEPSRTPVPGSPRQGRRASWCWPTAPRPSARRSRSLSAPANGTAPLPVRLGRPSGLGRRAAGRSRRQPRVGGDRRSLPQRRPSDREITKARHPCG